MQLQKYAGRFTFAAKPNRIGASEGETEIKNSGRHRELGGPGVRGALVSEEDAGGRSAGLVRAAFRNGRSQFDLLFSAGFADGRTMVRRDTERFRF